MRYVLLSDIELVGGAAVAAGRLAAALVARGHDVHWLSANPDGRTHAWRSVPVRFAGPERFLRLAANRAPGRLQARLNAPLVEQKLRRMLDQIAPDVVNVHNVHWAHWQPTILDAIPRSARILWTLHDMWSLTGRCAYAYDCRRFVTGCNAECPTPNEYPQLQPRLIAGAWAMRAQVLARHPHAVAVAPSRWLAHEAKAGLWRHHDVAHIPYGVPADEFKPVDRVIARTALGLDARSPVIAVMADDLTDRRKGWQYLQGALARLPAPSVTVLLIGANAPLHGLPPPHAALVLGRVEHVSLRRMLLSAADCFVHPAPVDNLPNVVLEALACGTPVLAFPIGGLPDIVRPGTTGWLASEVSAAALAETLLVALSQPSSPELRATCRRVAATEYAMELQAQRYEALLAGERADLV